MDWEDVPATAAAWAGRLAKAAAAVRRAGAAVVTDLPVGYYLHALEPRLGLYARGVAAADVLRCKAAAETVAAVEPLDAAALADGPWVKVAYSPHLRRLGELLNFFPGQYTEGVPNRPGPLAAMLSSGLLGAGLGWAAGSLGGRLLPAGYGHHLGRSGALVGGLAGAAPGALWAAANAGSGRPWNDPSLLQGGPDALPDLVGPWAHGANTLDPRRRRDWEPALDEAVEQLHPAAHLPGHSPLAARLKRAAAAFVKRAYGDAFADFAAAPAATPADVSVDRLGRVLWDSGASPALTGTVLGTALAAGRLPDPRARPGLVTAGQLGRLAAGAVGDYGKGLAAGLLINTVLGTPYAASSYGVGAAGLGLLGAAARSLLQS